MADDPGMDRMETDSQEQGAPEPAAPGLRLVIPGPRDMPPPPAPDAGGAGGAAAVVAPADLEDRAQFVPGVYQDLMIASQHRMASCLVSHESGSIYFPYKDLKDCIYGSVKLARVMRRIDPRTCELTETDVAIKCINKRKIREGKLKENPLLEVAAMQHLGAPGHRNVLKLIECVEDENGLYAIMPFAAKGEFFDVVVGVGKFEERVARRYFCQITRGLAYLHARGICHLDMSLENVLLTADDVPLIMDFGLCQPTPPGARFGARRAGKIYYMSPEVLEARPFHGHKADIWALGVMLFIMITGAPPFERAAIHDSRFNEVVHGRLGHLLHNWRMLPALSPEIVDLLSRILVHNPDNRMTLDEILAHPWLMGG